ncbi:phosphoribosylanthranilate isomerase [Cloacibacterium normanense]|uniref:N-(5'-phosphoribosyl)anthranilate isomerase n=1 Tax=Cloacibacterium normanense TaxID=237258 RepID=A0A1E5UD33_9FLAO|nr:phosphoribosylanthranilate isomerase [Cloacibacterium normanense]AZI69412.1 phosphoribosylanthranilate isomerase [Cloacibacterium normanense]OEL10834.1 N-(5'phosphoribosyl)anthranilate (PRA) isomerase family protein [Cloacibacterium normanense]SDO45416.1 phosphoribosylanthranilate isomerase [Cloacibacterium normanense]
MKLKVCGLTKINQIQELISLNTNFLGFIFYEKSPRFVLNHLSLEEISEINHQGKVGVFVNETVEKIVEISEKSNLNFIQLHGDEDEEFVKKLRLSLSKNIKIIKVIRIGNDFEKFKNEISKISNLTRGEAELSEAKSQISNLLFDTDSKAFGGTGQTFDWQILNEIEIPVPYFLSGGISLENLENLKILNQKPLVLDINSKFETEPGSKDLEKIKTFKSLLK